MIKNILTFVTLLSTLFIAFHCKSTQSSSPQKVAYKAIYIDQFKLTYFRSMLQKAYNNSKAIQEILNADHSGFAEPILTASDYKLIDSLTTADNERLIVDSTEGYRRAEGAQGKRPLQYILGKMSSNWLDSLAKRRFKISDVPVKLKDADSRSFKILAGEYLYAADNRHVFKKTEMLDKINPITMKIIRDINGKIVKITSGRSNYIAD